MPGVSIRELGNGAIVGPPDDGRAFWFMGHLYDTVADAQTSGGAYSVTRIEIAEMARRDATEVPSPEGGH